MATAENDVVLPAEHEDAQRLADTVDEQDAPRGRKCTTCAACSVLWRTSRTLWLRVNVSVFQILFLSLAICFASLRPGQISHEVSFASQIDKILAVQVTSRPILAKLSHRTSTRSFNWRECPPYSTHPAQTQAILNFTHCTLDLIGQEQSYKS